MILVDTSVWVDFLNGVNSKERIMLHDLLEKDAPIATTGIIITEILQGIRGERDFLTIKASLPAFPLYLPKAPETYVAAAALYRECRQQGRTIRSTVDCIIAAICLEQGLSLLHKDADFDHIAACSDLICITA